MPTVTVPGAMGGRWRGGRPADRRQLARELQRCRVDGGRAGGDRAQRRFAHCRGARRDRQPLREARRREAVALGRCARARRRPDVRRQLRPAGRRALADLGDRSLGARPERPRGGGGRRRVGGGGLRVRAAVAGGGGRPELVPRRGSGAAGRGGARRPCRAARSWSASRKPDRASASATTRTSTSRARRRHRPRHPAPDRARARPGDSRPRAAARPVSCRGRRRQPAIARAAGRRAGRPAVRAARAPAGRHRRRAPRRRGVPSGRRGQGGASAGDRADDAASTRSRAISSCCRIGTTRSGASARICSRRSSEAGPSRRRSRFGPPSRSRRSRPTPSSGMRAFGEVENALAAEIAAREREQILAQTLRRQPPRARDRPDAVQGRQHRPAIRDPAPARAHRDAVVASSACRPSSACSASTCTSRSAAASSAAAASGATSRVRPRAEGPTSYANSTPRIRARLLLTDLILLRSAFGRFSSLAARSRRVRIPTSQYRSLTNRRRAIAASSL